MMFRTMLIAAAFLAVAPAAARAGDGVKFSPAYELCLAAPAGQSTYGMLTCGEAEIKVQDARLNRAYKSDMTDLAQNPAGKAALLKAQRAWIVFRDADCATIRAVSGGTIASIYVQSCYLEHTAVRADALEDLLKP